MATKIQVRRDSAADWNITNPSLAEGEIGFETDTGKFKIGNGSSLWSSLDYFIDSSDLLSYATVSSLNSGIVSASAAAVSYLIDSAPAALDTLNELAAAIADDANYATTITTALATKSPLYTSTNAQTGSIYTLVLSDAGKYVEMNNASSNTLTVPLNASVAFPIGTEITVIQTGSGATTISPAGGVTVNYYSPTANAARILKAQWAGASLIKRDTNTWVLIGNLT